MSSSSDLEKREPETTSEDVTESVETDVATESEKPAGDEEGGRRRSAGNRTPTKNDREAGGANEEKEEKQRSPVSAEDKSGGVERDEQKSPEKPQEPEVSVPEFVDLNEFQTRSLSDLHLCAQEIGLRVAGVRSKHQLVFEILSFYGRRGTRIEAEGFIDFNGDSYGFLRWPALSFASNIDDVYVAVNFIRKLGLKPGNLVRARVRAPRDREKFLSVEEILTVEGKSADEWQTPVSFDQLTPLFPKERLILEHPDVKVASPRVVDLIAPLGKGQRGLIVAPPRGGKTILLKNIALSIQKNHPEVELLVLLLDERPEEVTDFKESVDAQVFSSTFDENAKRHVQVSDMVAERAKRLVEQGRDVVILLDSLTRLARGHNSAMQGGKGGGRLGSGGIDTKALQRPRKFFGAARNVEEGGSLTILATCLIETESRMDEVIFEEFKGTGNMEIYLDRELAEKRVFPAIHAPKSGTRKDELLYHPDEFKRIGSLRRQMAQMPAGEAMETLVKNILLTNSNAELLLRGLR
ncbi:MAG: transcription termination factor Rho [Verrucomicrobiae bacterium]|nr:transcription termination factor Rho [Verrucomicrobiae bacterium]